MRDTLLDRGPDEECTWISTEVIFHAYEGWDIDFVQKFYRIFVIAVGLYVSVLRLVRDRPKPSYYSHHSSRIACRSEIKD
jgi:asparagine synthetase B (glutamine-hydrolysing)